MGEITLQPQTIIDLNKFVSNMSHLLWLLEINYPSQLKQLQKAVDLNSLPNESFRDLLQASIGVWGRKFE